VNQSLTEPACERCGKLAQVHITNQIGEAGPAHHFCLECADRVEPPAASRERRLNHSAVLVVSGIFILGFSLLADQVEAGRSAGFGWKQILTLSLGLVMAGAGTLIRATMLLTIGGAMVTVGVLALWMRLGDGSGFGIKQITGVAVGLLVIFGGLARARLAR
jgi:hypothetical protein